MLEDNFVVSLLVLWPFFLQCSAQSHQFRSIPIPCDDFTRFQQFIIHHTEMVPPNAEHNLGTVNIRSGCVDAEACPGIPHDFCAWDYRSGLIFLRRLQCDVKTLFDSVFKATVYKQRNTVPYLRAFYEPQPKLSSNENRKSKLLENDVNLARKLTSSVENKFMMQTQIH